MARTERLFTLLQALRQHRFPVSGASLAAELGISLRTLYRDIATCRHKVPILKANPAWAMCCAPASCCRR
jgi:predicted DNA-binding transcriptional regulator YafY